MGTADVETLCLNTQPARLAAADVMLQHQRPFQAFPMPGFSFPFLPIMLIYRGADIAAQLDSHLAEYKRVILCSDPLQ